MAEYRNQDHYADPTAYMAMKKVEQEEQRKYFRPLVYICSPYAGDVVTNVEQARKYCRYAVDHGYIPVASHLMYPQFLDMTSKRNGSWACCLERCYWISALRSGCLVR